MPKSSMSPAAFRSTRERKGYSKLQLAHKMGVSQRTVAHWEMGDRRIPKIAEILLRLIKKNEKTPKKTRKDLKP